MAKASRIAKTSPVIPTESRKNVLFVDDTESRFDAFASLLSGAPVNIVWAPDVESAVPELDNCDILFLDYNLAKWANTLPVAAELAANFPDRLRLIVIHSNDSGGAAVLNSILHSVRRAKVVVAPGGYASVGWDFENNRPLITL